MVDDIHKSLKLYYDNEPAVCYAHNNKSNGAVKRIDKKFYVVKDKVRDHSISLRAYKYKENARESAYKRLNIQCVQRTLSRHGFTENLMIPKQ